MTRKRRSRQPVRDRLDTPEMTSLKCRCGKRLGLVSPTPDGHSYIARDVDVIRGDGVRWVEGAREPNGIKRLAHEDWHSVTCPRCGENWQGRVATLRALAETYPGKSVAIRTPVTVTGPMWQQCGADYLERIGRYEDARRRRELDGRGPGGSTREW